MNFHSKIHYPRFIFW